MEREYGYKLTTLVEELKLDVIYPSEDFEEVQIYSGDVHRPGLQFAGCFDYFDPTRVQLIGRQEEAFLKKETHESRLRKFDALFAKKMPALITCHGVEVMDEMVEAAKKYGVTVLQSPENTTDVMAAFIRVVKKAVAPRITRHGVLVEVYGMGLLLLGESGVGKSEAAIELLKRGHRLIADDAVEIRQIDVGVLEGTSPELIRHYVELRGIGVVDVRQIFGIGAVKPRQNIHLVVNLEVWKEGAVYDRLGLTNETMNILGVEVASITVPVKPGRNLAVILEVAAMNQRQKFMGYNAAVEFTRQIDEHLDRKIK